MDNQALLGAKLRDEALLCGAGAIFGAKTGDDDGEGTGKLGDDDGDCDGWRGAGMALGVGGAAVGAGRGGVVLGTLMSTF